jgi:transposase
MSALVKKSPLSIESLQKALSDKDLIIARQARLIKAMEETIRLQKLRKFGASLEKSASQTELFNQAELAVVTEEAMSELAIESAPPIAKDPARWPGRKPLPAALPRIRLEHDVPTAELNCPCGHERVVIGEETSEQLDIIPAKVQVLVHVRKKYACKQFEAGVITAPLPPQPIPRSNASPGLLAHVVISMYQDALPLHRQEVILARHGLDTPRNTLAGGMDDQGRWLDTAFA